MDIAQNRTQNILSWVTIVFLYSFSFVLVTLPSLIAIDLEKSLGISFAQIGFISSAFYYFYTALQIPGGLILDRIGPRKLLVFSSFLIAAGSCCFSYSSSYIMLFASQLLIGLGASTVFISLLCLTRSFFSAALFPLLIAIIESGSGLGPLALQGMYTILNDTQTWRMISKELTVIAIALFVLTFIFVKPTSPAQSGAAHESVWESFQKILKNKYIWLLFTYGVLIYSHVTVIAGMWRISMLKDALHISQDQAIYFNGIELIGISIGCLLIGALAKHISIKKIIITTSIIAMSLNFIAHWLLYHFYLTGSIYSEICWFVTLFLHGVSISNFILVFPLLKDVVDERDYGVASGFVNMGFGLSAILLVPLIGYLYSISSAENFYLSMVPVNCIAILAPITIIYYFYSLEKENTK